MFKTQNIIAFLVAAAVVGFFLDQRRQRMQSRELNIDRDTGVRIAVPLEPGTAPEVVG